MAIRIEEVAGMDFSDGAGSDRIEPVLSGNVMREDFMVPLGLSARALAGKPGVPSNRITAVLGGTRRVTAETAILLGERFGTGLALGLRAEGWYFETLSCRNRPPWTSFLSMGRRRKSARGWPVPDDALMRLLELNKTTVNP